jgi:hypothetical protein
MVPLTPEQQYALDKTDVRLRVVDPRTEAVYVLVRADDYEVMRGFLDTFNRAGWDDPALDVYEQYQDEK